MNRTPWIYALIVFPLICLLGVFLMPGGGNSRESARKTMCLSNLKQMATSALIYIEDNGGRLPHKEWVDPINSYAKAAELFTCSIMVRDKKQWGYAMNSKVMGTVVAKASDPTKTTLVFEVDALAKDVVANTAARSLDRHPVGNSTGSNESRLDSSAKFIQTPKKTHAAAAH